MTFQTCFSHLTSAATAKSKSRPRKNELPPPVAAGSMKVTVALLLVVISPSETVSLTVKVPGVVLVSLAVGPIAMVEVQGYAFAAWRAMAVQYGSLTMTVSGEPSAVRSRSRC